MKTVVINLECSSDRRALMKEALDGLGVEFEFFSGIDGWHEEHLWLSRHDERASILDHQKPLSVGEVGCFASHYLLWQRCFRAREPFVILEDDVTVASEFPRALDAARELIVKLRLIRLGLVWGMWDHSLVGHSQGFEIVQYKSQSVTGTQGYALSPEAAGSLLAHAAVWSLPLDLYMGCDERHGVKSFGLHPLPLSHADQHVLPSVIRSDQWGTHPSEKRGWMRLQAMKFLALNRGQGHVDTKRNPID